MAFKQFLARLLAGKSVSVIPAGRVHFEEPTGYYTVRGDGFDGVYREWLKSRQLVQAWVLTLGAPAFLDNLHNRSGYVREFCLRALTLLEDEGSFKPVLQRLNDYVPGNRYLALQLVLKYLAELPLDMIIDALPEIEVLKTQSRVNHAMIYGALSQRLDSEEGRASLEAGLVHHRAKVRWACWKRCESALTWSDRERIQYALHSGDPAIARSVEKDVLALSDGELMKRLPGLHQIRAMPLRRAFLIALWRKHLADAQTLIAAALWDDSYSIRWLGRHWSKEVPEALLQQYAAVMQRDEGSRHKRYALEGLSLLKLPDAVAVCKAALQDAKPVIRKAALSAACAVDEENQLVYVAAAMQDTDWTVVREAFRLLVALGLPLPTDVIAAAADARREELPFFELLLQSADHMGIWKALHLASFTGRAQPSLQTRLAPAIGLFLKNVGVTEVYTAPTQPQWRAICAWMPMEVLPANSGLRYVMDIYAKQMGN